MGNPCADWPGYRQYVIASLSQLQRLDGQVCAASRSLRHVSDSSIAYYGFLGMTGAFDLPALPPAPTMH